MASGSRTKNRRTNAERARQTRRRITAAATTLFVRDGYLTTTMAAIATEAGVAVQTLYLSFGNKTAILHAAFDESIAGDDDPTPLQEREWLRGVLDNPDGVAGLRSFVAHTCALQSRVGPLYGAVRAAAADPEVAELLANNKAERHAGFSRIVKALSAKPGFTSELSVRDAIGVLYAVQSEEAYALFVEEHGWTVRRWQEWTERTLVEQLFPGSATG